MEFVKSLWRGNEGLALTFWGMGLFVPLSASIILYFLGYQLDGVVYSRDGQTVADGWLLAALLDMYGWFILVCLWRSARIYVADAKSDVRAMWGKSIWGYLTLVLVVFSIPYAINDAFKLLSAI